MKWVILSDLHMNFKNCNTLTARDRLIEALIKEKTNGQISFVLITGEVIKFEMLQLKCIELTVHYPN